MTRTIPALLATAGLAIAACGGPVVSAEGDTPDQLALTEESTTTTVELQDTAIDTAESPTTVAAPTTAATTSGLADDDTGDTGDKPEVSGVPAEPAAGPPTTGPAPTNTEAPAETTGATTTTPAAAVDGEGLSLQLLNELRVSEGLEPLIRDTTMDAFAREWSTTMSTTEFEHSDGPYGENIAWASSSEQPDTWAADTFHTNWVNSPGHYANMTSPNYTQVGIGIINSVDGWYATHVFK